MAAKQKRGKGIYAYQAKKTGGQIEKPVNENALLFLQQL